MLKRLLIINVLLSVATAGASAGEVEERFLDHIESAVDRGLDPLDFHHLYLAFAWLHTLPDLEVAERALDRLSGVRQVDPLMADEVRLLRARLAADRGRQAQARELFRAMGGLSRWWVAGPESIEELEDVSLRSAPADDVEWRAVPGTDPEGWVRVAGLAWPARRQLVFLATTVTSDRERQVALRIGAAQVARAWLNGRELLTTPQPLARAEDQHSVGGWLREGRNLLVVAVASENDDWWLRARLTEPNGEPLEGVGELDEPPSPTESLDRPTPEIRTLEAELRRAMTRGRDGAAIALAAFLVARHPDPTGAGDARSVCRAARVEAPGEARLLEWRLTSEPVVARELLADAVAADPELHWARIELARWYHRRGLHEEAAEVLNPAIDDPAAAAAALELEADLWGSVVLPDLVELVASVPRCLEAETVLARVALATRRWQLAGESIDRLTALAPGAPPVIELEQLLAEACGDAAGLKEAFARQLAADPNQVELRIRLARLLAPGDGGEAAHTILQAGLSRCGDHVELLMELASLEHRGGSETEAARLARRVLELRPQEQRAQRLLELVGESTGDLEWLRSPDELWRLADSAVPGTPAVVVLDRIEVRFLPSQLIEKRAQQVFLITEANRADEFLTHTLPYVSERQRLRILAARILRRDGAAIGARKSDTPRLAEPEFNLFYDTRLRVLRFNQLENGDLVEISYVLTETAESNDTGPYEGGIIRLGQSVPMALAEIELSGPEQLLPAWDLVLLEGDPERIRDADGTVRLRWRWHDLPPLPADIPPPPDGLTTPQLRYSNHPEWGELATWYDRHIASRVRPSRQVEETALRLTEGVDDRLDRIARIYRFVTMEIRYVGLEFGEHRFRPFSADWVLNHRIGDCKDKAALLVALYGAIGIPARMVMVRTSERGAAASGLALLENFDHAIAYLPEDDLWLDGTASGHAPFPPPTMCQGAQVLVVDGPDSSPQITPVPGAGRASYRYRLRPADDGQVRLHVRTEDTGEAADRRRVQFAGSQDPRRLARWLQGQFPGADLMSEPKLQLIPAHDPTIVELEGVVSRSALAGTGGIRTYPGEFDWASRLTPSAQRTAPLLLPVRPDLEWSLEVELGRPPEPLPTGVQLDTRFGSLALAYKAGDDGYTVTGSFRLTPGLIEATDVAELRSFLVEVERQLARRLEVP
jgi:tetratricopeptide (TPR) repeat protein